MKEISYQEFEQIDIRVGEIILAEDFPSAHKPAYKLTINFGEEIGIKKSSAQITKKYTKDTLVGMQVLCVINFPPKQIGTYISEVLTLGFADEEESIVLATTERAAPLGKKLF
jgi:tRNA-binding protein